MRITRDDGSSSRHTTRLLGYPTLRSLFVRRSNDEEADVTWTRLDAEEEMERERRPSTVVCEYMRGVLSLALNGE